MCLANRSIPLLGDITIEPCIQGNISPFNVKAKMSYSPIGEAIMKIWKEISSINPSVKPLIIQIMPEHLHCILHVMSKMTKPLGQIIASFKGRCSKAYWELTPEMDGIPLFVKGYQDTILFHKGQLDRMIRYVLDNPRRLAIKRLYPNLFQEQRLIPFAGGFYSGIGNHFLLDYPILRQVQVSRSEYGTEAFEKKKADFLYNLQYGTALVSPCINKGERDIAYSALEKNVPLIILKHNGFNRFFKPSGFLFDACAMGRILMLAPSAWGYTEGKPIITREKSCVLNSLAQMICGENSSNIIYKGYVPPNLNQLIAEALTPPNF